MSERRIEIMIRGVTELKFYGYECFSGCGHISVVDKYYKTRRMHCAVCGTKETMVYIGEYKVEEVKKLSIFDKHE